MVAYVTEKPGTYRPRLVDERLQRLLSTFGSVEIRGTKWCGKSWAALAFGESVVHLDDPNVKALVASNPAARNPEPEFSAVVTATSPFCRHDAEHDVYVFPITALRP